MTLIKGVDFVLLLENSCDFPNRGGVTVSIFYISINNQ